MAYTAGSIYRKGDAARLAAEFAVRKASEDAAFRRNGGMHPTGRMYVTPRTGNQPLPADMQAEVDRVAYQNSPQAAAQPSMRHVLGAYAGTTAGPTVKQRLAAASRQYVGPQAQGDASIVGSPAWIRVNNEVLNNPAYGDDARKQAMQNLADAQSGKLKYGSTQSVGLLAANTKADADRATQIARFQNDHAAAVSAGPVVNRAANPLGMGNPRLYAMQNGRTPAERQAIYQGLLNAQKKQAMAIRNANMGAYANAPARSGASPVGGGSPHPTPTVQQLTQATSSMVRPAVDLASGVYDFVRPFNGRRRLPQRTPPARQQGLVEIIGQYGPPPAAPGDPSINAW